MCAISDYEYQSVLTSSVVVKLVKIFKTERIIEIQLVRSTEICGKVLTEVCGKVLSE